jgi:ATPase family AAA domain-containing protein 2
MDGMDGRGQVVVIGATNRPDSVDPALRRPGRFDREFYFPLPNTDARRAILDIHTKAWNPPLDPAIKDELAELTKGYGGADLRALCTEAALNAVQRRYPQIYKSQEKLLIDPKTIQVLPKDFMISVKKMVPSSERSASSGASPLPASIEPLLRKSLDLLQRIVAEILPQKKRTTALEEAQYEDAADAGFGRERVQQAFDDSRVFRPRLLVQGPVGMGQQYLAAALLNHFEGVHVQSFELSVLLGDSASSAEATMVRLFSEVKTHKPSVIYIPNVQTWYTTLGQQVVSTFCGLLRSLHPTDPILVLGILEMEKDEEPDQDFVKQLFGYSRRNMFRLSCPDQAARREYFKPLMEYVAMVPPEFPDPSNRKKRVIEELMPAPPEGPKPAAELTKEELKAQKKRDRHTLNMLKIQLQPIMDQIRAKYRKFRTGVIEEHQIRYLYDEADPGTVSSDLHTELLARASFRPYEIGKDPHGEPGLQETGTGKFFYNLDTVTIEKRLSNGYYKRPKDFLSDIKRLAKDARAINDQDRLLKANELLTNVEVDIAGIELNYAALTSECEKVYQRELVREQEAIEKAKKIAEESGIMPPPPVVSNVPHGGASEPSSVNPSTGPIQLGEPVNDRRMLYQNIMPITPSRPSHSSSLLTNGNHATSPELSDLNGSISHHATDGHDADIEGDTNMTNSDSRLNSHEHSHEHSTQTQKTHTTTSSSFGPSAQPRPPHSWTAPSQQMRQASGMSAPLSQKSTVTPMAAGSQAADYHNSASTTQTTSGKKNSGSSGEKAKSQELGPNLYMYDYTRPHLDGSQIPDTQREHYQIPYPHIVLTNIHIAETQNSQHRLISQYQPNSLPNSQSTPPVPPFDAASRNRSTSIHALLNDNDASQATSTPPTNSHVNPSTTRPYPNNEPAIHAPTSSMPNNPNNQPTPKSKSTLAIDHDFVVRLHDDVSSRTTGCSVEQLEQVNSVLMDTVWRTRQEWNRSRVALCVGEAFNKVLEDMEECGWELGPSSWGRQ